MKLQFFVVALLLSRSSFCFGQNKWPNNGDEIYQVLFEPDSRTNMTFYAYTNCPPQYTNVISNTNLFTLPQRELFKELPAKYKNVTTNSGPAGTVLTDLQKTNNYYIAFFSYTNSDAHEVIVFGDRSAEAKHNGNYNDFMARSGLPLVSYRTKNGDGYDATISRSSDKFWTFAEIKQGKVNGLLVDFHNDHCQDLLHFADGKAVGEWLEWDTHTDNRLLQVKIKSALDYFNYMTREIKE